MDLLGEAYLWLIEGYNLIYAVVGAWAVARIWISIRAAGWVD